jgi:lipopolysaccharide transport system ATP-binding protein
MASLLEVGTGFHPELTGRENVYMNGSILGMSKREIDRKFDEIVAFAEIEQFIDTPVKRYSSGMYVRLAFAVAAHLNPEILVVDEVLAVGDARFQQKCLGQMKAIGKDGRTVIFVSHQLGMLETLCQQGVYLDNGQVVCDGKIDLAIRQYRNQSAAASRLGQADLRFVDKRSRTKPFLKAITLIDENEQPVPGIPLASPWRVRIDIDAGHLIRLPKIGIGIDNDLGQRLLTVHTPTSENGSIDKIEGKASVFCEIKQFPLAPGNYCVKLALTVLGQEIDVVDQAMWFTVYDGHIGNDGRGFHHGVCVAESDWYLKTYTPL